MHASIAACNGDLLAGLRGEREPETTGEDNLKTMRWYMGHMLLQGWPGLSILRRMTGLMPRCLRKGWSMNPYRIYGTSQKPAEPMILSAGPFTLMFESGDLRYIRLGETEVLRRVYVAVRDHNWITIAGRISNLAIDRSDHGFEIRYDMEHRDGDVDFAWSAGSSARRRGASALRWPARLAPAS